jgi:ATP-dependent helicase/nuclease subunit A
MIESCQIIHHKHPTMQDHPARQQALDPKQSFIVQAPAGSGKTELLTQRFLTLLSCVTQPEQILAITFTRKAAQEMKHRIIHALTMASNPSPPSASHQQQTYHIARNALHHNKQHQWDLLNNPHRLSIMTIDAFCMTLTQKMPMTSGLCTMQTLNSTPFNDYQLASHNLLQNLHEDTPHKDHLITLLQHLDYQESRLQSLFNHMLAYRDQWLPILLANPNPNDLKHNIEATLNAIHQQCFQQAIQSIPTHLQPQLAHLCQIAGQICHLSQSNPSIAACHTLKTLPTADTPSKPYWLGITACLLTQNNQWRKSLDKRCGFPSKSDCKAQQKQYKHNKEAMLELIAELQSCPNTLRALQQIRHLPPTHYDPNQWQVLQSLFALLPILAAECHCVFNQHGHVDFTEVSARALAAINQSDHPNALQLSLDHQLHHILIDEFQDTSPPQFQLVQALVYDWIPQDHKTLFLVGDPMQSIYRFRQADVSLFLHAQSHGIGPVKLTPLKLINNFRSHPNIIVWINQQFPTLFPSNHCTQDGAIHYSPSTTCGTPNQDTLVQANSIIHEDALAEYHWVVDHILSLKQQHPDDSIGILVRARSHLPPLLKRLNQENIPYQAIDITPISEHPACLDLCNLTQALLFPQDRLAWISLLRSPLCGLSLQALSLLPNHAFIWDAIQANDFQHRLPKDDHHRLNRFCATLSHAIHQLHHETLAHTVHQTYLALGGPSTNANGPEILELFLSAIEPLDAQHLIQHPNDIKQALATMFIPPTQPSNLHIMTMHKAKGLEFDHVILPCLHKQPRPHASPLLLWEKSQHHDSLVISPPNHKHKDHDPLYQYLQHREQTKTQHELTRLLYVACTRAKNTLTLSAYAPSNDHRFHPASLAHLIKRLWQPTPYDTTIKNQATQQTLKYICSHWQPPIKPHQDNITLASQPCPAMTSSNIERIKGVCIHASLHALSLIPQTQWTPAWLHQQQQQWTTQFKQHGYTQYISTCETMMTIMQNTLNDPIAQWLLNCQHDHAASELELLTISGTQTKKIIIDRTFIFEGKRWIIDYKTTPMPSHNQGIAMAQQNKHQAQLEIYANALAQWDDLPIELALYFPDGGLWHHWPSHHSVTTN